MKILTRQRLWLGVMLSVLMISSASAMISAGTLNAIPHSMAVDGRQSDQNMRREIAFVDSGVSDAEFFSKRLSARMPVHFIKSSENGLERIAAILSNAPSVDAVHIFSHGAPGSLQLGDAPVTHRTLGRHKETLHQIGQHLNPGADILLYGCQVGKGYAGRQFINTLGKLTAANIAASDNLTGAAHLNGDWILEETAGSPGLERYDYHSIIINYPSVLAFPNTISWPSDPFGPLGQKTNYTISTTDLGNVVFKATDDGLGTAFSSLAWMGGDGGLAHASQWNGAYTGILIFEPTANYTNGIWFVFATQNGADFDFTSFNLGQINDFFNTMIVIGFRDGAQVATQSVTPMPYWQSATTPVSLSDDFDSVDEIRIRQDQSDWIAGGYPSSMDIIIDQIVLDAPAVANTGPTLTVGNGAYTENNGFTVIDASASANDADGDADWDSGAGLTVQITTNNEAADEISMDTSGSFSISAPNLSYSSTQIGTISEASGTANDGTVTNNAMLTINFNSNATSAIVQALVRAIAYRSISDAPTASTSTRTVTYTLTDKNSASVNDTASITITASNDPPTVAANTGLTLNEGATADISTSELNEGDPDDSGTGLTYTVTTTVANGNLWVDADGSGFIDGAESAIAANGTFTQADIDNGYLTFTHNGSETTSDSFIFNLADGGENSASPITTQTFTITITAQNDSPSLAANTGLSLDEGATADITTAELNEGDPDDSGTGLTYTVTAATANGALWVDADGSGFIDGAESAIANSGTFTQADIDNGYLTYIHNGGETTSDSFTFTLADGGENGAAALTGQTFTFTIGPSNDGPVITGQSSLTTIELQAITITLSDLTVTDPDNTYPDDFSLTVQNGANYTRQGTAITPDSGFTGNLSVPVVVNDGTVDSNTYNLSVYVATVLSVTNTDDSGAGSLRQIIADATGGDTIDLTQVSGTITLIGSGLLIDKDLTLIGPTDNRLIISGANTMRVLMTTSGTVTISDLTIADGTINDDGAAIYNIDSLALTRVTISNNTTAGSGNGGGIYNSGTLTARNCTFSGNTSAGNGGAVYNTGTTTLNNCTLADNSAAVTGGIYNTGTVNMSNTLIADQINGDCTNTGTIATNANNLIEDNSCSPALSGDPDLGPLQDNGGSTDTHALQPGSPAIDTADASTSESTDQRRIARPYDGDADNSSLPDIGSFEYQSGTVQFTSTTFGATETAASVTITVSRSDGSDGPVSVNYATSAGTASSDTDYTNTSGTLTWSDAETANKSFTVVITDDAVHESVETLTVALSNFSGALEGPQTSATVSIADNDTVSDDNDGMPEAWETEHGLDPAVDDADEDPDNDGLSNLEEYLKDSDPQAITPGPGISVLRSPDNLDMDQQLLLTFECGYSDSAFASDHAQTRWQVATDAQFVYQVLDITSSVYQTHLPVPNAILEENTVYFWRARYIDDDGANWRWSSPWSFTTGADPQNDDNNDGIADKDELPAVFIDIDGDGNDDHDQLDIKVIALPGDQGNIGIKAGSNVAGIDWLCHMTMDMADQEALPDNMVPPDEGTIGLYNFRLQLSEVGAAASVTVHYSVPLPANATWIKYDRINGWSDYSDNVIISPNRKTVTLNFVDGGIGDADGVANGIIADPSGPVVVQSGGEGGWGDSWCFISTVGTPRSINTGWIITTVLALIGFGAVCNRHK